MKQQFLKLRLVRQIHERKRAILIDSVHNPQIHKCYKAHKIKKWCSDHMATLSKQWQPDRN